MPPISSEEEGDMNIVLLEKYDDNQKEEGGNGGEWMITVLVNLRNED